MRTPKQFLIFLVVSWFFLSGCTGGPVSRQPASITPQIRSGVAHTCLLTGEGKVLCWGQNYMQHFNVSPMDYGKPMLVEGLDAIAITAGWYHTCSLASNGRVSCWGQNTAGQLGNDSLTDAASPVEVNGLQDVTGIAAGSAHTCAVVAAGEVYCWGLNDTGQLGDGTTTERHTPVLVKGLSGKATALVSGSQFNCVLLADGNVECWGDIRFLPVEGDEARIHTQPIQVPNVQGKVEAMAAGNYHLCVLAKSGEILCEGMIVPPNDPPFAKADEAGSQLKGQVQQLLAGTDFNCALTVEKSVWCWGDNYFGQLGDGTFNNSALPLQVEAAGQDVVALGGGYYTACALKSDGSVTCWGDTSFGQLGDGSPRWK